MKRSLLLALALVLSLDAAAETGGMWGSRGISRDFAVRGDLLYNADGRGVSVYRTGATIQQLDVEHSDAETLALTIAGDELFVATRRGVLRYAIQNDGTLTRTGDFEERGGTSRVAADAAWVVTATGNEIFLRDRHDALLTTAREIAFANPIAALQFVGRFLYVAVEQEGVHVIDPQRDGIVVTLPVSARGFALQGTTLWAAAGPSGIAAIDVGEPHAPRVVGMGGGGEVNLADIAVAGTRAFAIQPPDKVFAFDIGDRAAPRLVATLTQPASVVAANGERFFIAGSHVDMYGLASETGAPVRMFDAASRTLVAEFRDHAGPVSGAATDGTFAYVVDPPFFRVLDVSTTANPREVASIEVPRIQDRIRIKRGLAVIYGRGLVNLVDISNPYKPRHMGTYDSLGIPPSNAGIARDTIVEANYASGLHVVDYSDPANPVQISGRIWHYLDLVVSDDVIYAFLQGVILVADLSNRFAVVDVVEEDIGAIQAELAPAAAAQPDFLLVRTPTAIHIFDVKSDPLHPREITAVPVMNAGVMGVNDGSAYFEMDGSLWHIDLRAPGAPQRTERRVTSPMQIAGAGQKIVVADRYSLRVYGPDTPAPKPPASGRRRAVRPN